MQASVREVKSNLSKYGAIAHSGKAVTVTKNGKSWFQLTPLPRNKRTVKELDGVSPVLSESEATSSIPQKDLEGWI